MPADFVLHSGDTGPLWVYTPSYRDNSTPNLANATATLTFRSLTTAASFAATNAIAVSAANGTLTWTPSATDTATSGNFVASFAVTLGDGKVETFPQDGYLWVSMLPTVSAEPQLIVELEAVKDHLNISDHDRDAKLMDLIAEITPMIEEITGPILPKVYDEWYDGGSNLISLDHRPATGYEAQPVLQLISVTEFRGPVEYPLALVPTPGQGTIYSVMVNPELGTITRRGTGGSVVPFAMGSGGREGVHVIYRSGLATTPPNIQLAAKEAVRQVYEWTRQVGRGSSAPADQQETGAAVMANTRGLIRMLVGANRRGPSMA